MSTSARLSAYLTIQKDVIVPLFESVRSDLANIGIAVEIANDPESISLRLPNSDPAEYRPFIKFYITQDDVWCEWCFRGPDMGEVLICSPFEEMTVERLDVKRHVNDFLEGLKSRRMFFKTEYEP